MSGHLTCDSLVACHGRRVCMMEHLTSLNHQAWLHWCTCCWWLPISQAAETRCQISGTQEVCLGCEVGSCVKWSPRILDSFGYYMNVHVVHYLQHLILSMVLRFTSESQPERWQLGWTIELLVFANWRKHQGHCLLKPLNELSFNVATGCLKNDCLHMRVRYFDGVNRIPLWRCSCTTLALERQGQTARLWLTNPSSQYSQQSFDFHSVNSLRYLLISSQSRGTSFQF